MVSYKATTSVGEENYLIYTAFKKHKGETILLTKQSQSKYRKASRSLQLTIDDGCYIYMEGVIVHPTGVLLQL